ncbi:MAG: glutamate--tRNA ligase [bacterium]|nr:glutamate--tRNA ligase [bacterium]
MKKDTTTKQVRVRMAPSPTGPLHLGTARTALFNWLYARHFDGVFVLRIEDTDLERSDTRYEQEIFDGFKWLGIDWDEGPIAEAAQIQNSEFRIQNFKGAYGPYRQSERLDIYEKYLNQLLEEKKAYYCYCSKEELDSERKSQLSKGIQLKYSGKCRDLVLAPEGKNPEIIRFKVEDKIIEFDDLIRGKISFDSKLIGDIAIAKVLPTGFSPLYNFAVTVDDATMEITHVIRGEDHIPNTPKQILIQEALGFDIPYFAHLPLILSPDRSKLSKRYVETSLLKYRDLGYFPQAIANFIAYLGWHPKEEKDIMTLQELVSEFDIDRVQKAGAIFNEEKLTWLNAKYLNNFSDDDLVQLLVPRLIEKGIKIATGNLKRILHVEKGRMKTLNDFFELADFFFNLPEYASELLIWKNVPKEKIKENLVKISEILKKQDNSLFSVSDLEIALTPLTKEAGKGEILWPMRAALSGKRESPSPYEIAEVLGKEETVRRLEIGAKKLL